MERVSIFFLKCPVIRQFNTFTGNILV